MSDTATTIRTKVHNLFCAHTDGLVEVEHDPGPPCHDDRFDTAWLRCEKCRSGLTGTPDTRDAMYRT